MKKLPGWRGGSEARWLDAAYAILIESGIDAVKVMPLAKALGLSRTSFYSHFSDREALLDALIQRWRDKNTGNLIAQTEHYADTICEAVFNLFDCWIDSDLFDARLDFAIRNWAQKEPRLKRILDQTDMDRMAAIAAMFSRFGFDALQSEIRGRTVYYTQVGYIAMMLEEPLDQRLPRMPAYVESYTGCEPTRAEVDRFMVRHRGRVQSGV